MRNSLAKEVTELNIFFVAVKPGTPIGRKKTPMGKGQSKPGALFLPCGYK